MPKKSRATASTPVEMGPPWPKCPLCGQTLSGNSPLLKVDEQKVQAQMKKSEAKYAMKSGRLPRAKGAR